MRRGGEERRGGKRSGREEAESMKRGEDEDRRVGK